MMHLRLTLAAALVAVLAAAAPASAAPPTLGELKRCYVALRPDALEPVDVHAGGFTPMAVVDFSIMLNGVPQPPPPSAQADPAGDLPPGSVPAPYVASGQLPFTLTLTEHNNAANTVSRSSKVTALSVIQTPARASTHRRVRFRGRGFTREGAVYAHYVFRGKSRATRRVAKPYGDCGLFSVRMRQFPFRHTRTGDWTIQFDQSQRYDAATSPAATLVVKVRRRIRR